MTEELYRTPQAELIAPSLPTFTLADRSMRLAAAVIDNVTLMIAIVATAMADGAGAPRPLVVAAAVVSIGALLAVNLVWMARHGQSVGKRLCRIRVVRSDGSPVSLTRYFFARALPAAVFNQLPLVGLIDALAIFRDDRRCIHDHMADTIVILAYP